MKKENKTHGVQLLIRCVVRDPDGKIITDTGRKPAKSFVIQFLEFIYAMGESINYMATSVENLEKIIYAGGFQVRRQFNADDVVNSSLYGVVVGTGDTAETNLDIKLETQLTEGVGLGNITHGETTFVDTAVVGANVDAVIIRSFTNNTGLAIVVEEAGIYAAMTEPGINENEFCIIRDVLAASVEVPDKCSLAVYYTLRTTV